MILLEPVECAENKDIPDLAVAREVYYAVWEMAWDHFENVTIMMSDGEAASSVDKNNLDEYIQKIACIIGDVIVERERINNSFGVMKYLYKMVCGDMNFKVDVDTTLDEIESMAYHFIAMAIMEGVEKHKFIRLGADLTPEVFFNSTYGQTPEPRLST